MNQLSVHPQATPGGRPAALAACAALAVALNATAIGLVSEASSRWSGVAALATEQPHRTTMVLVAAPAAMAERVGTVDASAPAGASTPQRRLPASRPTARTTPTAPTQEAPVPVMFYTYREVDSPAFPETDWNLDIDTLDRIGAQRLVFEVLVSDRGEVVGCTVLDPTTLADDVKRAIEKRLSETPVLPALRAGQLVASVRRIELVVASTPPDFQAMSAAHRP